VLGIRGRRERPQGGEKDGQRDCRRDKGREGNFHGKKGQRGQARAGKAPGDHGSAGPPPEQGGHRGVTPVVGPKKQLSPGARAIFPSSIPPDDSFTHVPGPVWRPYPFKTRVNGKKASQAFLIQINGKREFFSCVPPHRGRASGRAGQHQRTKI